MSDRPPDLCETRKFEIWRHYANDRYRAIGGLERATDDPRIAAVASLPEAVTEDDYPGAIQKSFLIDKRAPQQRLHAEGREEVDRHSCAGNILHALRFLQPDPATGIHSQLLERTALLLPIPEVRRRGSIGALRFLRIERFDCHEPRRIVRRPPQQSGVDDAEDRRVRADAER